MLKPPYPFEEILDCAAMTLATRGQDGQPHAAPVYFAADASLNLYFFSEKTSQHVQDLEQEARAAAAIYPESRKWQEIRGLQLRGFGRLVPPGEEWKQAWELYRQKFPFVKGLKVVVAASSLYAFVPDWVRLVDNRRGFGFKQEWRLR